MLLKLKHVMGTSSRQVQVEDSAASLEHSAAAGQVDAPGAAHAGGLDPNLEEVLSDVQPSFDPAHAAECGVRGGGMGGIPHVFRPAKALWAIRISSTHMSSVEYIKTML